MAITESLLAALATSRAALVAALADQPLTRVVDPASGWRIRDVLVHLAQQEQDAARALQAFSLSATDSTSAVEPDQEHAGVPGSPTVDRSDYAILTELGAARAQLVAALATLSPAAAERRIRHPRGESMTVQALLTQLVAEEHEHTAAIAAVRGANRSQWITQPVFTGSFVQLELLDPQRHRDGLVQAGSDPAIWTYIRFARADTPAGMDAHIAELLRRWDAGVEVPYVIRRLRDNTIVGVTRFLEIHEHDRNVELGTWMHPSAQGAGINPETKLLMIDFAFAVLGCVRVQIKTNAQNAPARRSLDALGAVYEGTIRQHIRTSTGEYRDSAYYSILAPEWPTRKAALSARIARKGTAL